MSELGPEETIPVLPLRDIVVFPHMIVPLFVGREKSIRALEEVMREEKRILLVAQKNPGDDDPAIDTIYEVGTVAQVMQLLKLPDGTVKVLVEGIDRAKVIDFAARARIFRSPRGVAAGAQNLFQGNRRACPLHGTAVRKLCEAEQESAAGSVGWPQRRSLILPSWPTPLPHILP